MPQIVCLCHGEYFRPNGGHLTESGKIHAQESAEKLSQLFPTGSTIKVYSSPVLRGRETAEIIAKAFWCELEVAEHLNEYPEVPMAEFWPQIVKEDENDLIILVTHFWSVKHGLEEIGKLLSKSWSEYRDPGYVEGWIVDVENASVVDFVR